MKKPQDEGEDLTALHYAIANLTECYCPVDTKEECNVFLSTTDLYKQLRELYPADYTPDTIVNLLYQEGWETFYHPVLSKFFWKVKKVGD